MKSIRRQLTRRLLSATLALLGFGLAGLLAVAGYAFIHQFDLALRTKALAISTVAAVDNGTVHVAFTDRFLRGFDDHRPRDFFQIWWRNGATLTRSESLGQADLPRELGTLARPHYFRCTLPTGRPGRGIGFVFQPKQPRGTANPVELELVVATDREDFDETLLQLLGLAAGCAVLLGSTTLWLLPRLLRQGLQPLETLGEQAAGIDAGSLALRFSVRALPEELQPIAGRLNDLLARLEHSFERERRFSANLAHELRTPIAELRNLAECALKWPESRDPATDSETLAIARQMETLTTSMLALARGERSRIAGPPEPVDLTALLAETWRPFAARAAARGLRTEWAVPAATASADPVLLRAILANLMDNAVAYTPAAGTIRLAVEAEAGGRGSIFVSNPTENLEPGDVAKLFDPFWRKEAARTGGQHVGLGLSLASSFATSMGWMLTASLDSALCLKMQLSSGPASPPRSGTG